MKPKYGSTIGQDERIFYDGKVDIVDAIANCIDGDASLRVDAGGEGIFDKVDSIAITRRRHSS